MDADIIKRITETIDKRGGELTALSNHIKTHPESGFREFNTANTVRDFLSSLGMKCETGLAITGVKARLTGKKDAPCIAVIGELDGISCPSHPEADRKTGLTHACGHNAQLAMLMGAAMALSDPFVKEQLCGEVCFFAVPSEEYSDLDYKEGLISQGAIKSLGGKSELIRIGAFDDINIALVSHLHLVDTREDVLLGLNTTNGFTAKLITMSGRATHAALSPDKGVNALNAAAIGLNALAYQRETFRDEDYVRVHAIVKSGGEMVNVIPDHVVLEAKARARTMTAMRDASMKINRAFEAGAHAMGAKLDIKELPGYLPVMPLSTPRALIDAAKALKGTYSFADIDPHAHSAASTDVGDLSHLMPVVGFTTGGFTGDLHSASYRLTDPNLAYILPAKLAAITVYNLLKDEAAGAHEVMNSFPQHLTKGEYLDYLGVTEEETK